MSSMLLANGALALLAGALYAAVGWALARRATGAQNRVANRMFVLWWAGLAVVNVLAGTQDLLLGFGIDSVPLHLAFLFLRLPPLGLALWGLLFYLAFLYTGRRTWLWPTGVLYALVVGVLGGLYASARATAVVERGSQLAFVWAAEPPGTVSLVLALFVLLPVLAAAAAYGTLWRRVEGRAQRYRVAAVSASLALWILVTLVGSVAGASAPAWWPALVRVASLAAPVVVLSAYHPPRRLRDWLAGGAEVRA